MALVNSSGSKGLASVADNLSVFAMKVGIFESLAHRLLNDLHSILRCSRGQNVRRARQPKGSREGEELGFFFRFRKALDLRKVAEAGMLEPFG